MFHEGEKVYHRGLKEKGTFVRYDKLDTDTAHVIFLEDGYYDTKRVSISLLEKAKDHNEVLKTSKGYISYVGFIGGGDMAISVRFIDNIDDAKRFKSSFLDETPVRLESIEEQAGEKVQRILVKTVPVEEEK
ncbi:MULTISPECIES: hypothetical protein [Bacillus cereus group]|uniref:Uncharacterized protein n=1 Tax=Bacillus cereus TaxID=1396 RepID=A0A9X6STD1_BACCE|nr:MULTISPECIES: hypothetical protein [Bacillus cereus group]MDA1674748.1 hypothetical protein [Bacillus cereus group sp. TH152-1LC]PDZ94844.1 hypothetical protein CON36_31600 [Bacillus cereus]PGP12675.1 hypothetical protein COA01_33190 [Bacillus cereus]